MKHPTWIFCFRGIRKRRMIRIGNREKSRSMAAPKAYQIFQREFRGKQGRTPRRGKEHNVAETLGSDIFLGSLDPTSAQWVCTVYTSRQAEENG